MHDFATKRNALFACLDDASNELKGTLLDQSNACAAFKRGNLEMNYRQGDGGLPTERKLHRLRGKESIFKKPELPIARCLKPRKLPDFQINPHKWKKYSLEDVDISDRTNSTAALDFLREIDERKDAEKSHERAGEVQKIEFRKSSKLHRNLKALQSLEKMDTEIDSPKLRGSKLIMPEYIVGQNKVTTLKKKSYFSSVSNNAKKERAVGKLVLSHLCETDEDEET